MLVRQALLDECRWILQAKIAETIVFQQMSKKHSFFTTFIGQNAQ